MNQQRVAVMGGSSGIGEATATLFVRRGAAVAIIGRDPHKLDAAVQRIGPCTAHAVDATSPSAVATFFAGFGPFDHLVLAVSGGAGAGPFAHLDLAGLRRGFEAKFWAHVATLQAALPTLRAGGSVTFVTAGSARAAIPGTAGLAAINGALEALVRPLAAELAPTRVNAVSPGVINTPWWDAVPAAQREAFFAQTAATLPVRRIGRPDEVAEAIVFVALNGFMTGTVIECDGGARLAPLALMNE